MKFRQGYVNVCKKAEKIGETREETRMRERKKEKNIELGVCGGIGFQYFYRRNSLGF